jgi:hypothetical protein
MAGAEPAAQVGAWPVQDAHAAVALIRFDQAGTRELTAGAAFGERRGRRFEARGSLGSQAARFALTLGITVKTTLENVSR